MTRVASLLLLLSFLLFQSCSTLHLGYSKSTLTDSVDTLCRKTGLQRVSSIKSIQKTRFVNPGYNIVVDLRSNQGVRPYTIRFGPDRELEDFLPEDNEWESELGQGEDDVRSPRVRAMVIKRANQFLEGEKWEHFGKPTILREGNRYLLSYLSMPEAAVEKLTEEGIITDPYVSVLVSPEGEILGAFWGS